MIEFLLMWGGAFILALILHFWVIPALDVRQHD